MLHFSPGPLQLASLSPPQSAVSSQVGSSYKIRLMKFNCVMKCLHGYYNLQLPTHAVHITSY